MALKQFQMMLVLLELLIVGLVQLSAGRETPAQKFQRQHIDSDVNSPNTMYCNQMMKNRKMTEKFCKPVNTFIHEPQSVINAVCQETKITCNNGQKNCHKSNLTMSITDCHLTGASEYPRCQYKTSNLSKHIIVACNGNVPVHFDGSV